MGPTSTGRASRRRRSWLAWIASAVALFASPRASRAQAAAEDGPLEVSVRGASTGAFVGHASTDTSAREPVSTAALLDELPGVQVRRLGAEGSFATLSVRGSASTQVGVVLGQIPLTSGADPSFDVGSMPLWPGADLRVYRGFAPANVGTTGYLGGVLVVEPPTMALGARTEWWTLAGSLGTLKIRAGDVRRIGDVTMATALSASRTDGDFTYPVEDPASGVVTQRTRLNAAVASAGGLERITLDRSWGTLGATILVDARRQGLPGSSELPTRFPTLETTRMVGGVDALFRTGARGGVHAALWGRRETAALDDPLGEIDPTVPRTGLQTITAAGGSIGWRGRPIDAVTLDVFADARREGFSPSAPGPGTPDEASRIAGGLGVDLAWRVSDAFAVSGSGRLDARRDDASGTAGVGEPAFGPSSDFAPNGHVGASFRFDDAAVIAAHAGALARPPGFVELYGSRGSLVGDPALLPERALSIDAGIGGDLGDLRRHLTYEIVGFETEARDLIAFLPVGARTFHAENIDRARLLGVEASVVLRARHLATRVSYTLLHTVNEADAGIERGRPLPGRPTHDLVYDASYAFGPLHLRYGLDVVAGTTVDAAGAIVLPPRVLHGVGAAVELPAGARGATFRFGVQVDNLFDERALNVSADAPLATNAVLIPVSDFFGFPIPGRTIWVTARLLAR